MNILQISSRDVGGGAEKVAYELFRAYPSRGHHSRLMVGYKHTDDPHVLPIRHDEATGAWSSFWWRQFVRLQPYYGRAPGSRRLCRMVHALAAPRGVMDRLRGIEDFNYPGANRLLNMRSPVPEVIHCHNLHGRYFDLRLLPELSRRAPLFLTLHDAWLLSGHCAHSLDCPRWKTGCGSCPDLTLYPAVRRDATAANWQRKKEILARCRLHVATPCRWLMDKVEESILFPAIVESRVIPYGVDLSIFRRGDRQAVRAELGLDPRARVLLFAANGIRGNVWKDYATLREAVERIAESDPRRRIVFLALGENAPREFVGRAEVRFVPFQTDPSRVARYYQAADLYLHAARADTFPNTALEALACGTPVVATAAGGIPEQIRSLTPERLTRCSESSVTRAENPTGVLVPVGDAEAMAGAAGRLLDDRDLLAWVGSNAARDAAERFGLHRHVDDYLEWYAEVLRGKRSASTKQSLVVVS